MLEDERKYYKPELPQLPVDLSQRIKQKIEQLEEAKVEEAQLAEESPTREANGDDLSDLFRTPDSEDPDIKFDDLVRVEPEDVYGEGGEDMSDLTDVSAEDIMGEDLGEPDTQPEPQVKRRLIRRTRKPYRLELPPTAIQRIR